MARLFSKKHDRLHVHKLLGLYVLLHFFYRAKKLVLKGESVGEKENMVSIVVLLVLHVVLNATSFIFHLPARRNPLAPMIWPAYRAHNLTFAARNIIGAIIMVGLSRMKVYDYGIIGRIFFRSVFVCVFMALADFATAYYKNGQETTRGMPYFEASSPRSLKVLKSFYMQCQFHATFLSVTDATLSFFSVFAIQVASFAMTLARKQKITSLQWHIIYAISLWSVYLFMLFRPISLSVAIAGVLAGIIKEIRQHFRANKYMLWILTIITHEVLIEQLPQIPTAGPVQLSVKTMMAIAALRYVYRLGRVFLIEAGRSRPLYPDEEEEDEDTIDRHQNTKYDSSSVAAACRSDDIQAPISSFRSAAKED